jgi:HAD superfamily hydrolase (TIGR01509 family)
MPDSISAAASEFVAVPPQSELCLPKLPNSVHALIFDMDGVLCDTMSHHLKAWEIYIAQTPALAQAKVEILPNMGGKRNTELLPELLGRPVTAAEVEHWGAGKEAVYRDLIRGDIAWLSGLLAFLNAAQATGLKIGLGTSACRENVELLMAQDDIDQFFTVKVMEQDVQHGKPDPQVYQLVAERLGVSPDKCLVFEDAVAGVQAAQNAGMACWGVLTTQTEMELTEAGASLCLSDFTDDRLTALLTRAFRQ